jgi:hypothetical protein
VIIVTVLQLWRGVACDQSDDTATGEGVACDHSADTAIVEGCGL